MLNGGRIITCLEKLDVKPSYGIRRNKLVKKIMIVKRLLHFLARRYAKFIIWSFQRDMEKERKEFLKEKERIISNMNLNFKEILKKKEENWENIIASKEERLLADIVELTMQKNKSEYFLELEKKETREAYLTYKKAEELFKRERDNFSAHISVLDRFQTLIADVARTKANLIDMREIAEKNIKDASDKIKCLNSPAQIKQIRSR